MAASAPNPELIYSLVNGIFKPQIIRLALLMDVFSPLASGPSELEAISRGCGCDPSGLERLLEYLVSLKLVQLKGSKYSLSPEAEYFLTPASNSYVGDMLLEYTDPGTWHALAQTLQSGQPEMLESENTFIQDAWLESYRADTIQSSLELWKKAGVNPKNLANFRVLDLGCGSAIKSFAFAQKFKNVWVTCLDRPAVLEVARDLATRMKLDVRVTYLASDLLENDLGQDRYEACLLGQLAQYLSKSQNLELLRKIHAALTDEGVLVIDAPMRSKKTSENTSLVNLMVWASNHGGIYSYEQYARWIMDIGYANIKPLNEHALAAYK